MVWYSHLLKNLSQFVVIHTVKGFGIVEKRKSVTSKPDPVQLPRLIPTVQAPASTPPETLLFLLSSQVHLVKAMVFPVVMHRYESWTIKKAEC